MPQTNFAAAAAGCPLSTHVLDLAATLPPRQRRPLQKLARLRAEAAAEVERLIAFLGATEPDADFEPSLGAIEPGGFAPPLYTGETFDRELGDDNGIGDYDAFHGLDDAEPALGWSTDDDQSHLGEGLFDTGPADSGIVDVEALADVEAERVLAMLGASRWEERKATIAATRELLARLAHRPKKR